MMSFKLHMLVASFSVAGCLAAASEKPDVREFIGAARDGDLDKVNSAIAAGVDVNATTPGRPNWTALHAAAERAHLAVLLRLIEAGADASFRHRLGETPLHWAVIRGPIEAVNALIAAGADIEFDSVQYGTPLGAAARGGRADAALALIEAGADIEGGINGRRRISPLMLASKHARVDLIVLLVEHGADVNAGRRPPLHWAGKPEVARALLDAGADVNIRDYQSQTALHLTTGAWFPNAESVEVLITAGADVNAKDNTGATPLHKAIRYRKLGIVKALIKANANLDTKDDDGHTPLELAEKAGEPFVDALRRAGAKDDGRSDLIRAVEVGDLERVNALIENSEDLNATGPGRVTAVQVASRLGRTDILQVLIDSGANVQLPDEMGMTPIYEAANAKIAQQLLDAGAMIGRVSSDGPCMTPLVSAVSDGRADVVDVLIRNGASVEPCGGQSPFAWAAFQGRVEVIKILIDALEKNDPTNREHLNSALHVVANGGLGDVNCPEHVTQEERLAIAKLLVASGAAPNAPYEFGICRQCGPLHGAAGSGHVELVKFLIDSGAQINASSPKGVYAGYTPLHAAAWRGHTAVVSLLLDKGARVNDLTGEQCYGGVQTPLDIAKEAPVREILVQHGGKTAKEFGKNK